MSGLVLSGIVIKSVEMTVRVRVTRSVMHSKYKKVIKRTKDYLAHDCQNCCVVGETVTIEMNRPISRRKKWKVALV